MSVPAKTSQVEGAEHQHDARIDHQAFPEPPAEECEIQSDGDGAH
jgi:hypothetical protein